MLTTVVLAGGLGTRVTHLTHGAIPKALLPVNGTPFIDLKLAELRSSGALEVVMLVGHRAAALEDYVGDGHRYGLDVRWVLDGSELRGTGGAVAGAVALLPPEFWVTYGDTLLDVPVGPIEALLADSPGAGGIMTVLHNMDRWGTSNLAISEGCVAEYRKGASPGSFAWIDYGMSLMRRRAFEDHQTLDVFDLSIVLQKLIARRALLAYTVNRRFYEVGDETGLRETEAFLARSQ